MQHIRTTRDPITIAAIFRGGTVQPKTFIWSGKKFVIEKVNLVYREAAGGSTRISYSVTAEGNYFKLVFETGETRWFVTEVFFE